MKLKKKLSSIIILFAVFSIYAQEGIPIYFDYLSDNYYLVYPSMAGANRQGGKIRLTARKQWFDVDKAPNLQTLNGHLRLGDRSGVGVIFFRDQNGFHSDGGIKATYAHHLSFATNSVDLNQLSFGLTASYIQSSLDESEFTSLLPDRAVSGIKNSVGYYNVDLGFSYHFMDFYTHFAVHNLLETKRDLYNIIDETSPNIIEESNNIRKYLFSVGHVFDLNSSAWNLEPSVLFQYVEYTKEAVADINLKAYYDLKFGTFWGGVSYRRAFDGSQFDDGNGGLNTQRLEMITPIVGINIKNFMVSYNYSYQTGNLLFDNGGYHQITLGYDFWQGSEPYDCNCPAINY